MNNNQTTDQSKDSNVVAQSAESKPNDSAGIYYSTSIKITDPSTGQVLLHARGE